jgi:monoamine oxidase
MGKEVSVCDSAIITFDNNDITTGEIPIMNDELLKALEEMMKPIMEKINELSEKIDSKEVVEEETEDECKEVEDSEVNEEKKAVDMEEEKKAMAQDAMDAKIALKEEFKDRDKLASEISKVVGSFDHLDMDFREVVDYGLKKLDIKADKGQEVATLNGYLAGSSKVNNTLAMDSQIQNSKFIPSYDIFK